MNWANMTESTMHSRPERRTFALLLGLSILLVAVFAAGMAIGYHSVYRHTTVASLATDIGDRR